MTNRDAPHVVQSRGSFVRATDGSWRVQLGNGVYAREGSLCLVESRTTRKEGWVVLIYNYGLTWSFKLTGIIRPLGYKVSDAPTPLDWAELWRAAPDHRVDISARPRKKFRKREYA